MNIDARWCGRASGSVTAMTMRKSAIDPFEENHLWPLMTQSSPSRTARVVSVVGSEPALWGSVMENAECRSPASSGSSQRSFCSGVPASARISELPESGAWLPNANGAYGVVPRISCISPSLTWPKPCPPSSLSRWAAHSPRALTCSCRGAIARIIWSYSRLRTSSGQISSRTNSPIQSSCSWNSGSVEKSHAIAPTPSLRVMTNPSRGSSERMKVVVIGATGNVGSATVRALSADAQVDEIVGIARRAPELELPKVAWREADITRDDLARHLAGADAVVHLAWLIQPSRDQALTHRVNVEGSARVFAAAAAAGVPAVVYASSVGAYAPGPKDRAVDESWPTQGFESSFYARHKAAVERILDRFEAEHPETRVVRLRPGLIFQREAATEIRRLFAGPLVPSPLVRRGLIPIVPRLDRLRFQAVHSHDVGDAYRLAVVNGAARGAYNIAAEPVLDPDVLAELLGARPVTVPPGLLRMLAAVTWRARLQPTPPGWLDRAPAVPILDPPRAREPLGGTPPHRARDALLELLEGMREGAGLQPPPLAAETTGPMRVREVLTGVGQRSH